jgi:hypothetical protein
MTKPSREEILSVDQNIDGDSYADHLEALVLHWYAAGQADQREKDAGICDKLEQQTGGALFKVAARSIRSQSND